MKKLIYVIGIVVVAGTAITIWSRTVLAPSGATTVGISERAPMSPSDMTIHRAGVLPIETWDAF